MPPLSRKRKHKNIENQEVNNTSINTSITSPQIETIRTDDSNRLSINGSIRQSLDISGVQNINVLSQSVDKHNEEVIEIMDEQMTQPLSQEIEPTDDDSNRWGDDINISLEPTLTQIERKGTEHVMDATERAKLNVAECGTIESITLYNFMCHSNFSLDFGPRINFIVGRNGSGKSAILTAVVLGLGGRASTTSRGKGIASFIKSGETQSKIIIKICNKNERSIGKQGFNVKEYGKSIIVERTINSSGASTYKIKSSTGKTMADRKEVLDDIIRHFNIQVDNPICVLNQEVSRNFLNTKNSRDKYTFFMKATLLEDMKNDYAASETDRSISTDIMDQKKQIIPEMTKDMKALERKVRMFNDLENHKEKFAQLNNEALWALVWEQKHKLKAVIAQIEKYQKKIDSQMAKINSEKEVIEGLETNKNESLDRLNSLVKEVQTSHEKVEEFKKNCNDIKEQIRAKEREERNIKTELMATNRDLKSLEQKIRDLEQQFSDESHDNRKLEISKLKEDMERLREEEQTLLNGYQEVNQSIQQLSDETLRSRQEVNQLSSSIDAKRRDIERLNQSRSENLKRFGPKFPELVRRIEDANKRKVFKHKPLGPIGNHIKLRDYSCALAVESCLKRNLMSFCCDNMEDKRRLEKIMRDLFKNERIPAIITRPFGPLHDVSRHRVESEEFKSFYDLIVVKEAPIMNCLIDQNRIEQILYIPEYDRAVEVMIDRNNSPKNCYQAYTRDGSVMHPNTRDHDFKTYANNFKKNANILMKDINENLISLKQEVNGLDLQLKESVKQMEEKKRALESKRQELNQLEARKKEIRNECLRKDTKVKELESIGDSPPVEISTLEEELQSQASKKCELEKSMNSIKNEREVLLNSYTDADNQMRDKRSEYDSLLAERHPLKENLEKIKNNLSNHSLILNKYEKDLKETMDLKTEEDNKLIAKETDLEKDKNIASKQTGEPIVTERSSRTVFNELKQLEKFLDEQERSIGDKEDIYKKYKESAAHYKRIKQEVSVLEEHLNRLKKSLELRRRGYVELRNFYSLMTKFFFLDVLKHKGFNGSLDIYHKEKEVNGELKKAKTLEIRVNPKADENDSQQTISSIASSYSDTRSLSGGERSYSTVAFILALWESAQSPFKILDEVDVFMDLVTRKATMDAMIEFASQKSGKQYIFLSPLKLQNLPQPELIKIFQMPEPIRT